MKKIHRDIFFGLIYILIGFAIGYSIWLLGSGSLYIRVSFRMALNGALFISILPAVVVFILWYRKLYLTPEGIRQNSRDNYPILILLILGSTLLLLVLSILFASIIVRDFNFIGNLSATFLYIAILSASIAGFSVISFIKCNP